MKHDNVKRRDFSKWTMAAFGGFVSGSVIGCGESSKPATDTASEGTEPTPTEGSDAAGGTGGAETTKVAAHACRGLNDCKSANNACRGQGSCASESLRHDCSGQNACKGQGGCGDNPLANDCKTKGGCHVPLMEAAWEKARKNMEEKWTKAKQAFGDAPPAKES